MNDIDIIKYIPDYPSLESGKNKSGLFSYEIARRKEFYDLKLSPTEEVPKKGFDIHRIHQELQARFFSPNTDYHKCLMFHAVGTGKTCVSSLIAENFKDVLVNNKPRPRALVLVPGEKLIRNYQEEVATICVKDIYLPKFTDFELNKIEKGQKVVLTKQTKERRLRKAISETYEIDTFRIFLKNLPNDEIIRERYSNRIIIIDEAHNLRIQNTKEEESKEGITLELYKSLHRFLHVVSNCRILLLTGTPIWDKVSEIASLMNLLLDTKDQLPTEDRFLEEYFKKGVLIPDKRKKLIELFRDKVSYLRADTSTAKRDEIGVQKPWLKYISVFPSAMSKFQYKYTEKVRKEESKGFQIQAREASNFVFSDSYGIDFMKKYVRLVGNEYKYVNDKVAKDIKKNLRKYSCKFDAIISDILKNPKELVFIYNEFVAAGGGGAINLALILQLYGFTWVKNANSIRNVSDKKRFAVITSKKGTIHEAKQIKEFLRAFNDPSNKYGDKCQIIIGSRTIAEGLTIKNVRKVHVVMPHWNVSADDQAIGRTYRFGSHDALSPKERYIKIFKHVATKEGKESDSYNKGKGFPDDTSFSKYETIDIHVYKIAEEKEYLNTQIYRLLKEISWDCPLTYARNVLKGDQDNTLACDYTNCNYRCDAFPEKYIKKDKTIWKYIIPKSKIINDTYNLFYSQDQIDKMKRSIIELFGFHYNLSFQNILELLSLEDTKNNKELVLRTVDELINARIHIKDRYGFGTYLKEENDIYFLDTDISNFSNYANITYIKYPLITEIVSLKDIAENKELVNDKQKIEEFVKEPTKENLDKISMTSIIFLLEYIQILKNTDKNLYQSKPVQIFLENYGKYLITIQEKNTIHSMYTLEYKIRQLSVPPGLIRIFDPEINVWKFVTNIHTEKKYKDILEQREKVFKTLTWTDNPYDIVGKSVRGKFKLQVKPPPGPSQAKYKGIVCTTAGKQVILDHIFKIDKINKKINDPIKIFPEPSNKIKKLNKGKQELIHMIKAQQNLKIFFVDLDQRTEYELQQILTINHFSRPALCNLLEDWFKRKGLYSVEV